MPALRRTRICIRYPWHGTTTFSKSGLNKSFRLCVVSLSAPQGKKSRDLTDKKTLPEAALAAGAPVEIR
jgi:hypothetical protein